MNLANRWMIIRNSRCRRGLGSLRGALNVFGTEHAYGESGVLYWLSCYNARINERTGMALFSRHFLEQYQKRTAAMPGSRVSGRPEGRSLPSKPRNPQRERTEPLCSDSGKRDQQGKGSESIQCGASEGDCGQLWGGGTLDVNGDSVSLDSLTLESDLLMIDCPFSFGGEMVMLGGGTLTLDDQTSLPGPTDATSVGGGVPANRGTRCADPLPEEPRAVEGWEDADKRRSRAA